MAPRTWTCRSVKAGETCGLVWPRTKQKCSCGAERPKRRVPKHQLVLELIPYERWVERFGERCGICGRPPSAGRRLDRDHDHRTGAARGLLCFRCNRALQSWISTDWLRRAAAYLEQAQTSTEGDW